MKKILRLALSFLLIQMTIVGVEEITTIGNIQTSSKSLISTQVSGRVEAIFVQIGDKVKKAQPLVQLDKRIFEIEMAQKKAALEIALVDLSDAEKNFLRMQKLWEKEEPSISLKRFEDAKTKYEQATFGVNQAQENFNKAKLYLEESTIVSPYDGVITKKMVDVGESITNQPVTNILEIQTLHPLFLEFSIPQIYSHQLKEGTPIHFIIEGVELNNQMAKIDMFYPTLDENTRSLRCRAILNNEDCKIKPGSLARVKINILSPESQLQGND